MNPHVLGLGELAIQCGGRQANSLRSAMMVTSSMCLAGAPGASGWRELPGFVGGTLLELMGWFKGCWVFDNRKVFLK